MKNFPWFVNYPSEVPKTLEPYPFKNLVEWFSFNTKKYANNVAFYNFDVALTYDELDKCSTAFAAYLQKECRLQKGERIAIQMPNLLQFPVAFFGALKAGLIVVNTNPLYTAREMEHQFNDAKISAVVIVENFAYNLEAILPKIPSNTKVIVTKMGDMLGIKGHLVNFVVKYIKKLVPKYKIPKAISFKDALKEGFKHTLAPVPISLDDLAVLQYTGGTTGISKGAQLTHKNLLLHTQLTTHWFKPIMDESHPDLVVTAIPMYHIFALSVNGLLMFNTGASNLLITNPRDIPGFIKELKKYQFTIFTGVNTLYNGLMNNPEFEKLDFSHLKVAVGGGMAVQEAVALRWEKLTGKPIIEGYGLSETSPVLCCNPLNGKHRLGHIGVPMPDTEVAIMDDNGNVLPAGESGEICARGPQVMKGYWNSKNENVFFHQEWFRTGDIGIMSEDGFFKIVDRKKDMIKVSGFNVFPSEIEAVLAHHPKILEVAAIGVPDEKSSECIKVFIVKRDASLTEQDVREYCLQNLTKYKIPRHIEFRNELPKTNVGKILRRALKEETKQA